jgi:Ca2+:H+ antiporter
MPPTTTAAPPTGPHGWRGWLTPTNLTLVFIPAAVVMKLAGAGGTWMFLAAGVGIVPMAGLIGRATESLAVRTGPGVGGLLNATFGNAAELIIALVMLSHGPPLHDMVKATITGSIIGNVLLVLGAAILAGGLRHPRQSFNRTAAGVGTTLLAIAAAGLVVPTLFFYLPHGPAWDPADESRRVENLSEEIAAVLVLVYGLSLLFALRTHAHLYAGGGDTHAERHVAGGTAGTAHEEPEWGVRAALVVLLAATVGVAFLSEWLVAAVEPAAHALGMNNIFVGVIVVAVVGNAAEHSTAILVALRDKMDLAIQIAVSSSIQVALFVAPVLVFASLLMGHAHPLDLHFSPLEVAAVVLSVAVVSLVAHDGESNWLEGVMLLALYVILGLAFYNLPQLAARG